METPLYELASSLKVIAWIFIICGILAVLFSLFFLLIIKYSFFKGMAIVLLATGLLQIAYGCYAIATWHQTPIILVGKGMLSLNDWAMARQIVCMRIFTWISLGLGAFGILLFMICSRAAQTFWKGIGLGMAVQGALSAVLFFAGGADLNRYNPYITQQATEQTQCRKKIDEAGIGMAIFRNFNTKQVCFIALNFKGGKSGQHRAIRHLKGWVPFQEWNGNR